MARFFGERSGEIMSYAGDGPVVGCLNELPRRKRRGIETPGQQLPRGKPRGIGPEEIQILIRTDAAGRLLSITGPLERIVRYEYGVVDRTTRTADLLGGVGNLAYDANGNLGFLPRESLVCSCPFLGRAWARDALASRTLSSHPCILSGDCSICKDD